MQTQLNKIIIEACKLLLEAYEKDEGLNYCPLCRAVRHDCTLCPWETIEGKSCISGYNFSTNELRENAISQYRYASINSNEIPKLKSEFKNKRKQFIELRIPMLKRWIEILENS